MIALRAADNADYAPDQPPVSNAFLRTAVRHLLPCLLRTLFAGETGIVEEVDAADRKPPVLSVGRAGLRAGALGLDRLRLRAVVSPQRAGARAHAAVGAGGRDRRQSRHPRHLQICRLPDRQYQSRALPVRAAQAGAAAPGAADRRLLCGVRKDHLPRRHLARHLAAGGGVCRLLPVRAVLPKTAGGADPQISRDEGPDRLAAGDRMG